MRGAALAMILAGCGAGERPVETVSAETAVHVTRDTCTSPCTTAAAEPTAVAVPVPSPEPDPTPTPTPDETDWRAAYRERPALRTLHGRVSYYHDSLAGNPTASGPAYDPRAFTCASRDLAFGTVLRLTREDTGTTTIVRVNDRGPFGRARRLLDLSRAAAEELDMIARGVVEVRAEILEEGPARPRRARARARARRSSR